jgi:hypothetical protein
LSFINPHPIFKVVNDKDENRGEKIDSMDYGKWKIKLRGCDGQSMNNDNDVSFEYIFEIDIILVV